MLIPRSPRAEPPFVLASCPSSAINWLHCLGEVVPPLQGLSLKWRSWLAEFLPATTAYGSKSAMQLEREPLCVSSFSQVDQQRKEPSQQSQVPLTYNRMPLKMTHVSAPLNLLFPGLPPCQLWCPESRQPSVIYMHGPFNTLLLRHLGGSMG